MEALPSIAFEAISMILEKFQRYCGRTRIHLTNEGDGPLIISNAQGSWVYCSNLATIQLHGQTGEIKVFNSKGRAGKQDKRVTLTTNAVPQTKVLNITSMVITENNVISIFTSKCIRWRFSLIFTAYSNCSGHVPFFFRPQMKKQKEEGKFRNEVKKGNR